MFICPRAFSVFFNFILSHFRRTKKKNVRNLFFCGEWGRGAFILKREISVVGIKIDSSYGSSQPNTSTEELKLWKGFATVMKAFNSMRTLSNRLKYQTQTQTHTHTRAPLQSVKKNKINTEAMFIAWCAEISALSRSTFEQWIWIEAKKWLSFAFISSLDVVVFFFYFSILIQILFLFFSLSLPLEIRCRFSHFELSACLIFGILEYIVVNVCPT